MKVFIAAAFVAGVTASDSNKSLGTQLGDVLAAGASDPAFAAAYEDQVQSQLPVVVNPAVNEAIRATNAKASAASAAAFLKTRFPSQLNLHIADNPNFEATAAAELASKQRQRLMSLLKEEAAQKELLANAASSLQTKYEAGTAFLKNRGPAESTADVLGDAQGIAGSMGYLQAAIPNYYKAVSAGGYTAQKALNSLTNVVSEPNAKTVGQLMSPILLSKLRTLMLKESTPDQQRVAAGSIITSLTGLPVSSTTMDTATGGYGHVDIVVPSPSRVYKPDYEVLAAKAGSGSYYPSSFLKTQEFPFKMPEELIGDVNKGALSVNVIAEAGGDDEGAEMLKSLRGIA